MVYDFKLPLQAKNTLSQTQAQNSLEAARAVRAARVAAGKKASLDPLERLEQSPSRTNAIKAYCYTCVGKDCDPGWKGRVRACPSRNCPLYAFRPYK